MRCASAVCAPRRLSIKAGAAKEPVEAGAAMTPRRSRPAAARFSLWYIQQDLKLKAYTTMVTLRDSRHRVASQPHAPQSSLHTSHSE